MVILVVAVCYNVQVRWDINPSIWGLHPGDYHQWWGILTSPLVHGNTSHLFSNLIALAGLLALLFVFYDKLAGWILTGLWVLTGIIMFYIARPGVYHIGASGVAYAVSFYLLAGGILSNDRGLRIIAIIVALYYGSMVWGLFPLDPTVSWDGHVSGAISGVLLALLTYKKFRKPKAEPHDWGHEEEDDWEDKYQQFGN